MHPDRILQLQSAPPAPINPPEPPPTYPATPSFLLAGFHFSMAAAFAPAPQPPNNPPTRSSRRLMRKDSLARAQQAILAAAAQINQWPYAPAPPAAPSFLTGANAYTASALAAALYPPPVTKAQRVALGNEKASAWVRDNGRMTGKKRQRNIAEHAGGGHNGAKKKKGKQNAGTGAGLPGLPKRQWKELQKEERRRGKNQLNIQAAAQLPWSTWSQVTKTLLAMNNSGSLQENEGRPREHTTGPDQCACSECIKEILYRSLGSEEKREEYRQKELRYQVLKETLRLAAQRVEKRGAETEEIDKQDTQRPQENHEALPAAHSGVSVNTTVPLGHAKQQQALQQETLHHGRFVNSNGPQWTQLRGAAADEDDDEDMWEEVNEEEDNKEEQEHTGVPVNTDLHEYIVKRMLNGERWEDVMQGLMKWINTRGDELELERALKRVRLGGGEVEEGGVVED